jgi:hypothetical protein
MKYLHRYCVEGVNLGGTEMVKWYSRRYGLPTDLTFTGVWRDTREYKGILCRVSPVPLGKGTGTKKIKSWFFLLCYLCVQFCRFQTHVHAYMYICTIIHTYTYTHTYIHIHKYTYILSDSIYYHIYYQIVYIYYQIVRTIHKYTINIYTIR